MSGEQDWPVPAEPVVVAEFGLKTKYEDEREAVGWIVDEPSNHIKPFRCQFLPKACDEVLLVYPHVNFEERYKPFIWGYPLHDLAKSIYTCGGANRPRELYRLVHDGHPYGGKKPRGYGVVAAHGILWHRFFLKQLDWRCRNLSPFLSATDDMRKINHMYDLYIARGFENIRLIKFRTYGPGWDHAEQKLYHVYTLLKELGGKSPKYVECMANEYLIEGEIPPESIIWEGPYVSPNPNPRKKKYPSARKRPIDEEHVIATEYTACA